MRQVVLLKLNPPNPPPKETKNNGNKKKTDFSSSEDDQPDVRRSDGNACDERIDAGARRLLDS